MDQLRVDAPDARPGDRPAPRSHGRELALPLQGRPVFVIVGMHRSGASVLAKMLQLLGADMAEPHAGLSIAGASIVGVPAAAWERPEIVAFNDRLLDIIGRPLDSAAHALPFPAGWWGDPRVLSLKREVQAYLRATLDDRYGLWGFKDLRVTRLLPFWQQVFDEMGLRPVYLWTVREPAECAASAVASGLAPSVAIAEAMWFIYNADAQTFVGDDAVAIVDYRAWADAPADTVRDLLDRLPLNWRGSHGELLECVRAITAGRPVAVAAPIHSPQVQRLYDAIRDPERSDGSRRYRHSVAQAVDILRTLVAPYATLVKAADRHAPDAAPAIDALPPTAPTSRARDDLAAALARADAAEATLRETEQVLTREIEARVSENTWLQQQYLAGKRALAADADRVHAASAGGEEENARLRQELETIRAAQRGADDIEAITEERSRHMREEMNQLRRDLALQKTANEKYLSRIYELKANRKSGGGSGGGGGDQPAATA